MRTLNPTHSLTQTLHWNSRAKSSYTRARPKHHTSANWRKGERRSQDQRGDKKSRPRQQQQRQASVTSRDGGVFPGGGGSSGGGVARCRSIQLPAGWREGPLISHDRLITSRCRGKLAEPRHGKRGENGRRWQAHRPLASNDDRQRRLANCSRIISFTETTT